MKKTLFALLALVSTPALADTIEADKFGGFRAEAHVGIERPNLNDRQGGVDYVAKLSSSVAYGAEIGYDIPVSGSISVGPYAAYDLSSSKKCETGTTLVGAVNNNYTLCTKSKSNISVGLRGAFKAGRKGEAYVGLGYDIYDFDLNLALKPVLPANAPTTTIADISSRKGVGFAFGYNHMVAKSLYLGAGGRISSFGKMSGSDFNLQRSQLNANLGVRF